MKRLTDSRGFSLVELGVTLAILGITATIAYPSLRGLIPRYRFNAAVQTLSVELNLARLQSISRDREYKFLVSKASDTCVIYEGDASESSTSWTFKRGLDFPTEVDIYDVGSVPADTLVFNPNGTYDDEASGDGLGFIYIKNQDDSIRKRLRVAANTGRITIERYVGSVWVDERYL